MKDGLVDRSDSELRKIWLNKDNSKYSKTFIESVQQEMLNRKIVLEESIEATKTSDYQKPSRTPWGKYVFMVTLLPFFYVSHLFSNTYRVTYYPEMSNWEFMPYETIFGALALTPLMFAVVLLFKGLQLVYRGLGDKAKPYKWNEWVSVILIPVTLLATLMAYQITKIYCLKNYPQMHVWEFWIYAYYICVYVGAGLPIVSLLASAIIGRKFFGLKNGKI